MKPGDAKQSTLISVSQGTIYPEFCPDCSAPVQTGIAQHLVNGKLMWSRSRRCEACGCTEEHDTDDEGMAFFRNILITKCRYGIELSEISKPALMVALQAVRPLSIRDAEDMSGALLSGKWGGTHPEAALVAEALQERGYVARVTAG